MGKILVGCDTPTIEIKYFHIYYQPDNNIYGNPAKHNDKPLPSRFTSKFPRLWWTGHLVLIHAFIYQRGYFHIAKQRQKHDTINRLTDSLFEKPESYVQK